MLEPPWMASPMVAAQASRFPRDGDALDAFDNWLSSPIFHLRLSKPAELLLSIPGCFFGMPAAGAPAALLLALLTGGHGGSSTAWPLTAMLAVALLCIHFRLMLAWDEARPVATAALAARTVYSVGSVAVAPLLAIGAAQALELPGGGAAYAYLLVWYSAIGPVLALKQAARRRRPIAAAHHPGNPLPHKALRAIRCIISHDSNASFPSGDAAGAVAFALPLWRCAGLPVAAVACVLLSCAGRLYWQAHHLLDVTFGALVALSSAVLVEAALSERGGLCSATWWHPIGAQAGVLALVKTLKLDSKLTKAVLRAAPGGQPMRAERRVAS
jgi:membrane-associated phospholipid phosphatase